MVQITRRSAMVGGAALMAAPAFAQSAPQAGAWRAGAGMPMPVQEIYPAPFMKPGDAAKALKFQPFDILVSAGGLTPEAPFNVTDRVFWYDPATDAWGDGAPLPRPRHHIALVAVGRTLYALGGFARNAAGGWQMRADCWRTGSVHGPWTPIRPLPHPQAEAVCVDLGGFVHMVGGRAPAGSSNAEWSDHIDTDEHRFYDPSADRWFDAAPMPTPRNSAAGAVVNGVLYVIGGRTVSGGNTAAVEVYDPMSDRWGELHPMPKAQGGLAAAALGGKIYVFGGEYFDVGDGGVFREAWEYDPRRDAWRAVADMPRPRHGLGAVPLGEAIYVVGGAAKAGGEETSNALDVFSPA